MARRCGWRAREGDAAEEGNADHPDWQGTAARCAYFRLNVTPDAGTLEQQVRACPSFEPIRSALQTEASTSSAAGGREQSASEGASTPPLPAASSTQTSSFDEMFCDPTSFVADVDDLITQSPRKRKPPERFSETHIVGLRDCATGVRKVRKLADKAVDPAGADVAQCSNAVCMRVRTERDFLKRKRDEEQGVLRDLCVQLDRVCDGLDQRQLVAAHHIQQALLELLDDELQAAEKDDSKVEPSAAEEPAEEPPAEEPTEESSAEEVAEEPSVQPSDPQAVGVVKTAIAASFKSESGVLALVGNEALSWAATSAPAAPSISIPLATVASLALQKVRPAYLRYRYSLPCILPPQCLPLPNHHTGTPRQSILHAVHTVGHQQV